MKKIVVSSDWNNIERWNVLELIEEAISITEANLAEAQETCHWDAPYILQLKSRIDYLNAQRIYVESADTYLLELNRRNFNEFVG